MKKIFSYILAIIAFAVVATACTDEKTNVAGEGKVNLSLSIDDNVTVYSRALSSEELNALQESCKVYVYNSKGLIRKYRGTDEIPSELWLVSGNYKAEAWAGDSVPASFDKKYYKGATEFTVSANATAEAEIACKIANVVTSVKFDSSLEGVLNDCKMIISHSKGNLEFTKENEGAKGYFMMPKGETTLSYILTGVKVDGNTYTQSGEITDVKSATEYAMTIKYNVKEFDPVGGAMFDITVDASEVDVNDSYDISAGPKITANFDLTQPKMAEAGTFKKLSVYASAVEEIADIEIAGLKSLGFAYSDAISFKQMTEDAKAELDAFGVEVRCPFATEAHPEGDVRAAKISFKAELLNTLGNGSYALSVKVTDNKGKSRQVQFTLEVSDDAVKSTQVDPLNVWAKSADLEMILAKDNATAYGIEYRKAGAAEWTKVYAVDAARSTVYTISLSDLTPGTTYEYRAFADNDGEGKAFASNSVFSFTTELAAQLPNAGFEEWTESSGVILPAASKDNLYWDSGNHGSATMNKNITQSDSDVKNSGNYSAKLVSQFVGISIIGKFAAGNIFTGKYLKTDGTDGVLGFGRTGFASRPKSLSGYVKYNPAPVDNINNEAKNKGCVEGENDKGIIYVALLTDYTETFEGATFPIVVQTKSSNRNLFKKDASYVVAYGEWTSQEATSADNSMTHFEIPLTYRRTDVKPTAILVVCSASYWGDYFSGGDGSVMYIDDFTLNY